MRRRGALAMSKGLIIYKSKYGGTKKYVDILKKELNCDICEVREGKKAALDTYGWIVFAGGIYAGGIAGLSFLRKNCKVIRDVKSAILCVGASPFAQKALEEIKAHNLKGELSGIPVFYGRGIWDESRMSWKDRTLCKMLQKAVAKKDSDACEPWMRELLSAAGQIHDWTDRKYILPLLEYLR